MPEIKIQENSKKYSLNKEDGKKVTKGCLIALGGALLTYVAELLPNVDFGSYTPLVVAIGGVLVNLGWKFMKGK